MNCLNDPIPHFGGHACISGSYCGNLALLWLSNHKTRNNFAIFQIRSQTLMLKKRQQTVALSSLLSELESKMVGLGCMMASAGISFSIISWTYRLLAEKGFPF